jgi:hypothetical protein
MRDNAGDLIEAVDNDSSTASLWIGTLQQLQERLDAAREQNADQT